VALRGRNRQSTRQWPHYGLNGVKGMVNKGYFVGHHFCNRRYRKHSNRRV